MVSKKLLVTGCPRSGTTFAATLFTKLGLPLGHEKMRQGGCASWMFVIDTDKYPYQHEGEKRRDYKFEHVFHQVRHPLKVISSLEAVKYDMWDFVGRYVDLKGLGDLERRMKFWLDWNMLCEEQSGLRYRIEDIDTLTPVLCEKLFLQSKPVRIRHNINARPHSDLNWKTLQDTNKDLCKQVIERMVEYGYFPPTLT